MEYIKRFNHHSDYETYINNDDTLLPNLSYCDDANDIHLNKVETRIVAKFNVTSTSEATKIMGNDASSFFIEIEIDDVVQPTVITNYTFDTIGEHTVKYTLLDKTSIGNEMFDDCENLISIDFPLTIHSINQYSFRNCLNMVMVNSHTNGTCIIPDNITFIGQDAFGACKGITNLILNNKGTIGTFAFLSCSNITNVTIDNNVTSIGNYAFMSCSNLTNVTIGNNVTSIGENAFSYTGLTSIGPIDSGASLEIPNGVTSINMGTFQNCTNLTSVIIGNNITSIHPNAFASCSNLTSVTINSNTFMSTLHSNTGYGAYVIFGNQVTEYIIGDNVTSIGDFAFEGCSNVLTINLSNNITSIGIYAFRNCRNLTSINMPNNINITTIGQNTFNNCQKLTSITIPSGVTSIGGDAFSSCLALTSITIPSNVTTIADYAFYGCTGLTSITSLVTTAPTIQSNTFRSIKTGGTLYVPKGSTGYDVWMGTGDYYLGKYNWTKNEVLGGGIDDYHNGGGID